MKKILFAAFILSMAFTIDAQKITDRKESEKDKHEKMDRHRGGARIDFHKLNLTEDQKAKFKTQKESFRLQMEELKKNDNITVKDWKAKMKALRENQKTQMEKILTNEQKAQIETMKAEKKEMHESMAKERQEKMKTNLGITDAQSAAMGKYKTELQQKLKVIKEDKKLTDDQKKEKAKELLKSHKESMKSILTEEQLKKLKESKERKPSGHFGGRKKPDMKEPV